MLFDYLSVSLISTSLEWIIANALKFLKESLDESDRIINKTLMPYIVFNSIGLILKPVNAYSCHSLPDSSSFISNCIANMGVLV